MADGLKNQVAIITGGGSGIGKALAKLLASQGATVEIFGKTEQSLRNTCSEIGGQNSCRYTVGDVSVEADVNKFASEIIGRHKQVDIVVNSAGWISQTRDLAQITEQEFDRAFAVNVKSIFLFSRKFLPIMERQGSGTIVNITSTAGIYGSPLIPIYSASKFAARGLTQAIGKVLPQNKLSYFSVAPSGTNTPMREKIFGKKDALLQQSAEVVAAIIVDAIEKKLDVQNGGEIVVRDGKVAEINNPIKK